VIDAIQKMQCEVISLKQYGKDDLEIVFSTITSVSGEIISEKSARGQTWKTYFDIAKLDTIRYIRYDRCNTIDAKQ
jgi:hypothetical protein